MWGINRVIRLLGLCTLLCAIAMHAAAQVEIHDGIVIRQVWIPMPDGVRLAADLYLPEDMDDGGMPVLLEYLPYRKDESRQRNFGLYSYFRAAMATWWRGWISVAPATARAAPFLTSIPISNSMTARR